MLEVNLFLAICHVPSDQTSKVSVRTEKQVLSCRDEQTFEYNLVIETRKNGETVLEYAPELKKLYDKAHARRDKETT